MSTEIAGLPVTTPLNDLMTPLAAVAVIKGLNKDGHIIYCLAQTAGLNLMETIGMHESAAAMHKNALPGMR